jgi:hypothetical protein
VAFPKLIDQIKESESHKSFIKLNSVGSINETPEGGMSGGNSTN